MHPIILAIFIISSLGLLVGLGVLVFELISSFKANCKKILFSKTTWLIGFTILSVILALSYKNFFYGFPAVPLLIAFFTVILLARKLAIASVIKKNRWISILMAIFWGIWSFCIYFLLQTAIMPDYPTLHHLREHAISAHGAMVVGIAVWEMIFSIAINLGVAIRETKRQRVES